MQLAQLPVLAALADPKVQLIPLHQPAAEKAVCSALGLPRVGVLGLRADAPGAEPLFSCLTDVPLVRVPFLKEAVAGVWLGTKIAVANQAGQEAG
jgi:ribonuclease P/MRP protein subunit POP3